MDRRQNNRMFKAVSVRHCAATTAPRNCCPNCHAEQSHKDNVRSSLAGKQLKQKKSNSLSIAQHHLPALDLFWASSFLLRVQLTSLFLISPGLTRSSRRFFSFYSYSRSLKSDRGKANSPLSHKATSEAGVPSAGSRQTSCPFRWLGNKTRIGR